MACNVILSLNDAKGQKAVRCLSETPWQIHLPHGSSGSFAWCFFLVLPILCLLLHCLLWILDRHLVIIDMWTNAHIGDMHKEHRYIHIQIEFIFGTFGLFWWLILVQYIDPVSLIDSFAGPKRNSILSACNGKCALHYALHLHTHRWRSVSEIRAHLSWGKVLA